MKNNFLITKKFIRCLTKIMSIFCASLVSFSSVCGLLPVHAADGPSPNAASVTVLLPTAQSGCSFSIYRTDETVARQNILTDGSGSASIGNLPIGDYYIREMACPQGVHPDMEKHFFSVKASDASQNINVKASIPDVSQTIFATLKLKSSDLNFDNGNPVIHLTAKNKGTGEIFSATANISSDNEIDAAGYYEYTTDFGNVPAGDYTVSASNNLRYTSSASTEVSVAQNQSTACTFTGTLFSSEKASDTQNIDAIASNEKEVQEIIVNNPNPVAYKNLNTTGLTVTVKYDNGTSKTVPVTDPHVHIINSDIKASDVGKTVSPSVEYSENGISISQQFPVAVKKWATSISVTSSQSEFDTGSIDKTKFTAAVTYCDGSTASVPSSQLTLSPDSLSTDDSGKTVNVTASYSENGVTVSSNVPVVCSDPTTMSINLAKGAVTNNVLDPSKVTAIIYRKDGTTQTVPGTQLTFSQTAFPNPSQTYTVVATYTDKGKQVHSSFVVSSNEVTGKVTNTSNTALLNVLATFTDNGGQTVRTATDSDGNFDIYVKQGSYQVTYTANGHMPLTTSLDVTSNGITSVETAQMIPTASVNTSTLYPVSGKASNALNGAALSGAIVKFRTGWNNKAGSYASNSSSGTDAACITAGDGTFSSSLYAGYYTAEVSCNGFITGYFNITVSSNSSPSINAVMSPILASNEYRIVLTWGAHPTDLDSHTYPIKNGARESEVYYSVKSHANNSDKGSESLDRDCTSGYGPETTTIKTDSNLYEYEFEVYLYSSDGELKDSSAQVKVYNGSGMVASYSVPTNQSGNWWHVFRIVNGSIVPINIVNGNSGTYSE